MRLGLLGRGRAARTLAPRLETEGLAPAWWWSRGDDGDVEDLPTVDVILLAVPDGAIEEAAAALARRPGAGEEVWLHLSGSRPGGVCRVDETRPGAAGCLHPLQALPGHEVPRSHLAGATAGLDGEPEAVAAAEEIARALGLVPRRLADGTKPLYHAAAVTVAGHATALFAQSLRMLEACGFDAAAGRDALLPLLRGAVNNLGRGLPGEVITGPIARGDADTVARHLARLDALDAHLAETYRRLARTALDLSRPALTEEAARAVEAILEPPGG
ncbi:MAG: DUF2520 domain-containing protein [Myxococcota bacterium]